MRSPFRLLLCLCVVSLATASAGAQVPTPSKWGTRTSTRGLTVGPYATFGAAMTIGAPNSLKVEPRFAYRLGADATYPLTTGISATLGLGLDSRATEMYHYNQEELYEIARVNYFSITPGFAFRTFWLGLNMGIPAGGGRTLNLNEETDLDFDEESPLYNNPFLQAPFERDTAGLAFPLKPNFMLEPRIGARIPVMESESGWLGVDVSLGYTLNELFERSSDHPGDSDADYHMPSIHVGLSYKFGIPGTQHTD